MITLPTLLLILLVVSFWIIIGSKGKIFVKSFCICFVLGFILVWWTALPSFFGWAAKDDGLYDVPLTIYSVVIDEKKEEENSSIYLLVKTDKNALNNIILSTFGHPFDVTKPRFYRMPYTRELHKQLAESVLPKTQRGQSVRGLFKKNGGNSKKDGEGKDSEQNGDRDQSQEQDLRFYDLQPSHEYDKQEKREKSIEERMGEGEFLG